MRFNFEFSNVCGSAYRQGSIVFTPDGNSVLSPVGNRVTVVDLRNHKTRTLGFENRKNIYQLALSPDGNVLVSVDTDGRAVLVNFHKGTVLNHLNFKKRVHHICFSPDSKYLAVARGIHVQIWAAPSLAPGFSPFTLLKTFGGHTSDITKLQWRNDSQFLLSSSKDLTAKVYMIDPPPEFVPITLLGHRDHVVGAFFGQDNHIYTVARDGYVTVWVFTADAEERKDAENKDVLEHGRIVKKSKNKLNLSHAKVVCAASHSKDNENFIVVGYSTGVFSIYSVPEFQLIHSLSISSSKITSCAINNTGEWLAFGASKLGQLLVWEWQSETYVLKQQGHYSDIRCLAYSPDGQLMASGGDDGKTKIWNTNTGFCFVTFAEHSGPITDVVFSLTGTVVVSSSLDGTVRAFDLVRYRNFRTFTAPVQCQFISLAIDPSAEVICAGSQDPFEIYVWSLRTSQLLDVLSGHEGPISSLNFSSHGMLISGSWDESVRVWDIYNKNTSVESLFHGEQVLDVCFRPDGKQFCSISSRGVIRFWDIKHGNLLGFLETREDVRGGRRADDARDAMNSTLNNLITSVSYTPDGTCVIVGGNTKYIAMYHVENLIMVRKWQLSHNRALEGVLDTINSKNFTEIGHMDSDEEFSDDSDEERQAKKSLPGVKVGDLSRKTKPVVRCWQVGFSPTGETWCAATTEGLVLYSQTLDTTFQPMGLDLDLTIQSTLATLRSNQYAKALVMALRINDVALVNEVIQRTPVSDLPLILSSLQTNLIYRLIITLSSLFENSPRWMEFYLTWVKILFTTQGRYIKKNGHIYTAALRNLKKNMQSHYKDISQISNSNRFMLTYLKTLRKEKITVIEEEIIEEKRIPFAPRPFKRRKDEMEEMREAAGIK